MIRGFSSVRMGLPVGKAAPPTEGGLSQLDSESRRTVVVVMDGGVDYRHPDLAEAMWTNPRELAGDGLDNDENGFIDDVHGINVGLGLGDPFQGRGTDHGTHVAGIIGAADNDSGTTGVAAGKVELLSVGGMYDGDPNGLVNFERAVDYVLQQKAAGVPIRVINASFAGVYWNGSDRTRWKAAIQKLADADILLVTGTLDQDNPMTRNCDNFPVFPANADFPNVLTATMLDAAEAKVSDRACYGQTSVDLAAPGTSIQSTLPGGRFGAMTGTSMAAPHVSAAAALIFDKNPSLSAVQVRDIILRTVTRTSALQPFVATGGKLNVADALAATPEEKA